MIKQLLILAALCAMASGCTFLPPRPYIDLAKRTPTPVDPEVDRILSEWQKRRAGAKTVAAKCKVAFEKSEGQDPEVHEGLFRCRHSSSIQFSMDGDCILLWTPKNEFWTIDTVKKAADVVEFDKPYLNDFMKGTEFVWFSPVDKITLQKHGLIRKVSEDAATIVLAVKNAKRADDLDGSYESLTVHLRKPDLLPIKLVTRGGLDATWEFSELRENIDLKDADFLPPDLGPQGKIGRRRFISPVEAPKKPASETTHTWPIYPNSSLDTHGSKLPMQVKQGRQWGHTASSF